MRTSVKLILTALAASLLLSAMVSTASARNLSVSNQNIRATWTLLEFAVSREVSVRCQVTLEGSFHTRTIAKVADALIGAITRAIVKQEACREGTGSAFNGVERYNGTTTPNTLPWHITYRSFRGTLPNIESIRIALSRFRFGIRDSFGLCTGQYGNESDAVQADAAREAGGGISSLTPVEGSNSATLIRRDAGILCPSPGVLKGRGEVMLLGATTKITLTLI
jgi:hypothetical protein